MISASQEGYLRSRLGSLDIESDRNGHLGDIKEASAFSVLFEVHPMSEQRDNYLGYARMLRPELETVDGFRRQHPLSQPDARGFSRSPAGATRSPSSAGALRCGITKRRKRAALKS